MTESTEHYPYKKHNRQWLFGIVSLVVLACLLGYAAFRLASNGGDGLLVRPGPDGIGGSFRVVSLGGSTVTEADFLGSWMLVWFVDPRCPKAQCQSQLKNLDSALQELDKEGYRIRPLVLSLDSSPDFDSDDLKDYVMEAAPHILPFYATPNMVRAMTGLFHAPYKQNQVQQGEESKRIYYQPAPFFVLMTPKGRFGGQVVAGGSAAQIAQELADIIARHSGSPMPAHQGE